MKALKNYLDKIKPNFEEGGKLHWLYSTYDAFETFLFVPNTTSKTGVHIHDARDSKRTMIIVILALVPALLVGMYNVGMQHYMAIGQEVSLLTTFVYGLIAMLPLIVVSYVVGLGIEFAMAQVKKEEVAEGFLVSGMLIPMIVPIDTPLWMVAVATAFSVIFAKEVFGGTGYNIFNVALIARAFLFFSYPTKMSGDQVWVRTAETFGMGQGTVIDGYSGATPLGQIATTEAATFGEFTFHGVTG
ncbi:MAG: RnfABCDGE type electron transport complex subunit D, partial [Proteiniphilum sp.]